MQLNFRAFLLIFNLTKPKFTSAIVYIGQAIIEILVEKLNLVSIFHIELVTVFKHSTKPSFKLGYVK